MGLPNPKGDGSPALCTMHTLLGVNKENSGGEYEQNLLLFSRRKAQGADDEL